MFPCHSSITSLFFIVYMWHAFEKAQDIQSVNSHVFRGFWVSWGVSGRAGPTDITAVLQGWRGIGRSVLPAAKHLCRGKSRAKQVINAAWVCDQSICLPQAPLLTLLSLCVGLSPKLQVTVDLEIVPARWRKHCLPFTVLHCRIDSQCLCLSGPLGWSEHQPDPWASCATLEMPNG